MIYNHWTEFLGVFPLLKPRPQLATNWRNNEVIHHRELTNKDVLIIIRLYSDTPGNLEKYRPGYHWSTVSRSRKRRIQSFENMIKLRNIGISSIFVVVAQHVV